MTDDRNGEVTGQEPDNRRVLSPEIVTGRLPNLVEILTFLNRQQFDPQQTSYEFAVDANSPITVEALKLWSGITAYESTLVGLDEPDGSVKSFFKTGTRELTRSQVQGMRYHYRIHNHSESDISVSDPYPSPTDLAGADWSLTNLIISPAGLTLFENPAGPTYPVLPDHLQAKFGPVPLGRILNDIQIWAALTDHIRTTNPEVLAAPPELKSSAAKKVFNALLGIKVTVVPWEQEDKINSVLRMLKS